MTDVLILGPVLVRSPAGAAAPSSALTRTIIGVLALAGDAGLSVDALAGSAWPRHKPQVGGKALVVAVHRARQWLGAHTGGVTGIEWTTTGYVLRGADVDAHRFTRLAAEPDRLADALALWRGEPLADADPGQPVTPAIEALVRARLTTATRYGRDLLAVGGAAEAIVALTPLADRYPLDEPLHAVLIEALAGAGRQADALARYERLRLRLADELGVDPSRELSGALVRVLRQEVPATTPITPSGPAPAQLPPDVGAFAGRAAQLRRLDELAATVAGGSVVITAVAGIGGVGKTTLAVRWAHSAARRFPDGQLHIDLRGYAHIEPVPPIEALGRFLRALGVAPREVPADVDEAAALFRTLLAGRRMLVVLDNAVSADQVRPLLPGAAGCLVLVTSRDRLDGLVAREGARRLGLDVFAPAESAALLSTLLGARRVGAEPAATAELAELCGHLPLALRIAAAHLMGRPDLPIADHVLALRTDRLGELAITSDPMSSVRAVFDLSYARLSDVDRRVFRLLGVAPGTDVAADAVSVLCGLDACPALARLVSAHLVRADGGRYVLHDLVRDYARNRAEQSDPDRNEAVATLCRWYLGTADAAARVLSATEPRLAVPPVPGRREFADTESARAWLRGETHQLIAVIEHTAERGPVEVSWLITDAIRRSTQGMATVELIHAVTAARDAAERAGDMLGQAATEFNLTLMDIALWSQESALDHAEASLRAARAGGWAEGVAAGLNLLGRVLVDIGDLPAAVAALDESIDHTRRHGLVEREMAATNTLAHVCLDFGDLNRAVTLSRRALAYYRDLTDDVSIAIPTMDGYAHVLRERGELTEAMAILAEARDLNRAGGDERNEFLILREMALIHVELGNYDLARDFDAHELPVARSLGRDRYIVLSRAAGAHANLRDGRPAEALASFRTMTNLARRLGLTAAEIDATIGWALAAHETGDNADALTQAQHALAQAHRRRYGLHEARALAALATIHLRHQHIDWAATHAERALAICKQGGARLTEAHVVRLLGEIRMAQGHEPAALALLRTARQMFADMGLPAARELEALLDTC